MESQTLSKFHRRYIGKIDEIIDGKINVDVKLKELCAIYAEDVVNHMKKICAQPVSIKGCFSKFNQYLKSKGIYNVKSLIPRDLKLKLIQEEQIQLTNKQMKPKVIVKSLVVQLIQQTDQSNEIEDKVIWLLLTSGLRTKDLIKAEIKFNETELLVKNMTKKSDPTEIFKRRVIFSSLQHWMEVYQIVHKELSEKFESISHRCNDRVSKKYSHVFDGQSKHQCRGLYVLLRRDIENPGLNLDRCCQNYLNHETGGATQNYSHYIYVNDIVTENQQFLQLLAHKNDLEQRLKESQKKQEDQKIQNWIIRQQDSQLQ